MKNITQVILMLSLIFGTISCTKDLSDKKNVESLNESTLASDVNDLILKSGFTSLIINKATWQEVHENYLLNISLFKDDPYLFSYKQTVINYQILNTKLTKDLDDKKSEIIISYLKEIDSYNKAYPKTTFLALDAVSNYLDKKELATIAENAFNKGTNQKAKNLARIKEINKSDKEEVLKNQTTKIYEEDYENYLPRLKKFFILE